MQLQFHPHAAGHDPNRTAQLQCRRMMLQSQKLLLQATTPDGAALPTEELQHTLDRALEDTAAQLRAVKADRYEPGTGDTVPPGLYRQAGVKIVVLSGTEA